ncbi:arrestin domain-containing protein 3-like [Myripristis murdjan]|uniref:arrestin domain-containing protein 3-like n=1 Tax=Myripristis murdjan TaxID=586833 RepID=UPI001175D1D9|nr:arrestin domain-containing protein 3-like [Myripristis murdjan]
MFQPRFKNFSINFNRVNEAGTFSSGDPINGQISFELTKETKINSITLTFLGKAHVHWSTSSGSGKRRSRRHFTATVEFFKLSSTILQERTAIGDGTERLQPGMHVYPFSCQIPRGDFPSSFKGPSGEITYTLTVGIRRPWRLTKDFLTEVNFVSRIDINQPGLLAPLAGTNSMTACCLWCAQGPITMTARLDKKAFVPGETVKISCEVSNASSRTITPKIHLRQKQMFYTHNKANRRMLEKQLASETRQPIAPHTSDVFTEIMLTIPPAVSPTISNCAIIEVSYMIIVKLCPKGLPSLEVHCPIVLCPLASAHLPPCL